MDDVIRHVVIHGAVQGVGFRYWTENSARRRGLQGWVRNRRDGSVEAVFAGPPDAVAAMISECNHGPSSSRVETVVEGPADAQELNLRRAGEAFSSLPTL